MLDTTDTIVAPATPPGRGGIGIVRLSGPLAGRIGGRMFRSTNRRPLEPRRMTHGWVMDRDGQPLDEVLAVWMPGPGTYTGQDVLEIQAHGGPVVIGRVVDLCLDHGARPAGAGEFTWRAFMAGRIDLTQAEAVAEMIDAATRSGARLAAAHLKGGLTGPVERVIDALMDVLAEVEAGVDFPEEEIAPATDEYIRKLLTLGVSGPVEELIAAAAVGRNLRQGARVALIGRPNAGKSSLLNALLGRDRALVTEIPGTTRDYLEENLDLDGVPVVLTDTAGLREVAGEVANSPELAGMAATRSLARAAEVLLLVVDATADDRAEEVATGLGEGLEELSPADWRRTIVVANKCDLIATGRAETVADSGKSAPGVVVSAKTGQGLEKLTALIRERLIGNGPEPMEMTCAPSVRQEATLLKVRQALREAESGLDAGAPLDLVAVELREALELLGGITGRTAPEEVLNRIFERFCIGK